MNSRIISHPPGRVALGAALAAALFGFGLWKAAPLNSSATDTHQIYLTRLREGVGEISFAPAGGSREHVGASANSLAAFVGARSRLNFSGLVRARLAELEGRALNGSLPPLTGKELGEILTEVANDRVARLKDEEIERGISSLQGFDAPGLPDAYARGRSLIKPRASVAGPRADQALRERIRTFRSQAAGGDGTFRLLLDLYVAREVGERLELLSEAIPSEFPRTRDGLGQEQVSLTPLKAMLVVYSVVSDDDMLRSGERLTDFMFALEQRRRETLGHFPSASGQVAYGDNGYVYSSPLSVIFDEQAQQHFLRLVEERGTR